MERELPIRITVVRPVLGVAVQVQRGRADLLPATTVSDEALSFDFTVRVRQQPNGSPNFLGKFTQGRPHDRFVYVNAGARAGQRDSCWDRRAKVSLMRITPAQIREVLADPGAVLEARIEGTSRDGGPACATVPLLDSGWQVVRRS